MPTSLSLDNIGLDILLQILMLLNGSALIALSQTSHQMAANLSDQFWKKVFERDFGFQGLDARKVLGARDPDISWRDCYISCFYRKLVIWGSLQRLSIVIAVEGHRNLPMSYSLHAPHQFSLPATIIPRDVLCGRQVYVLDIDGKVSFFNITDAQGDRPQLALMMYNHIESPPGLFTEIQITDSELFALHSSGDWWTWSRHSWKRTFGDKRIWPGTLHTTCLSVIALSICGRYVYHASRFGTQEVCKLPRLCNGPPLQRFDNFIVRAAYDSSTSFCGFLVCLQVDNWCYVLFFSPSRKEVFMVIPTDSLIIQASVWQDCHTDRTSGTEDWFEFKLVCANGIVIQCNDICPFGRPPRLQFYQSPEANDSGRDSTVIGGPGFYYKLTPEGELYGEGDVCLRSNEKREINKVGDSGDGSDGYTVQRLPCSSASETTRESKVNVLPLTNFHFAPLHASALCLPPNESRVSPGNELPAPK